VATMVPDIDPGMIQNDGERMFYTAARSLPRDYTVLYSFRFRIGKWHTMDDSNEGFDHAPKIGEIDFVVVHPALGYVTIEVKQGHVLYANGIWQEEKDGSYWPMHKNPVRQARNSAYQIVRLFQERTGTRHFPLRIRWAVCFPESQRLLGTLPPDLPRECVLLRRDLDHLEDAVLRVFAVEKPKLQSLKRMDSTVRLLLDRVLSPRFRTFSRLDDWIDLYDSTAKRVFTQEQERILEETELDRRKVFLGAAGTGKTFLAIEKAKRLASSGKKVFLTCFNKNLAHYLKEVVPETVTCLNFHDYLEHVVKRENLPVARPDREEELDIYFSRTLPEAVTEFYLGIPEDMKFDSIIVDEGQDFMENWFFCLEAMVIQDGEFYVFADPNQKLFASDLGYFDKILISKHRLTRNLRNTETITKWIGVFVEDGKIYPGLQGGLRVVCKPWATLREEKALIEEEVGRLVSQGIKPSRIVILSPNKLEKSSLVGCTRIREWPLVEFRQAGRSQRNRGQDGQRLAPGNAIRFATIRSFKGLEADVVFLIGLREGKRTCTDADIYVGASRARFVLYVFYDKLAPPRRLRFANF